MTRVTLEAPLPIVSRHLVDPALLPLLDFFPPLELSADILPAIRALGPPVKGGEAGAD